MTATTDGIILASFWRSLRGVRIDEQGTTAATDAAHLARTARLAAAVQRITAEGWTPLDLLLHRLAALTEVLAAEGDLAAVRAWLTARAEALEVLILGSIKTGIQ